MTTNTYDRGDQPRLSCAFWTNPTKLLAQALAGTTSLLVQDASGFTGGDVLVLALGGDWEEEVTVQSVSGRTVTLTAGTAFTHPMRDTVHELVDPTTVSLILEDPTGASTSYTYAGGTVTKLRQGRYYRDHSIPDAAASEGTWVYTWAGSGTVPTAEPGQFFVRHEEA